MHIMFFIRKDVAEPAEKVVKSEADIEYEQQCPVEKYAIAKGGEYLVDNDGKVTYAARIYAGGRPYILEHLHLYIGAGGRTRL